MSIVLKYLKPYLWLVVFSLVMLFFQAMAELALPNYMSDIVNIGIQRGGVETAVPEAMRATQMAKLTLFMTPEEVKMVQAAYLQVDSTSEDFTTMVKKIPTLEHEDVWVLRDSSAAQLTDLNLIMGKALVAVASIEAAIENPEKAAGMNEMAGFVLPQLPAGVDVFQFLSSLPVEELEQMRAQINQGFASMDEKMVSQAALASVKDEYAALGVEQSRIQTTYIMRIGSLMLLITLAGAVCAIVVGLLSSRSAAGLTRDLRRDIFKKVESFSKTEFETFSTASLITRTTNDLTQIQMVVMMMLRMVFFSPILAIGAIIRAVDKSPSMTWIIGLGVAVLLTVVAVVFSIAVPKFKRMQKLVDRINLVTRESLSGLMVIRAFNTQDFELGRFDKANTDLTDNLRFVSRIMVVMSPVMMLIMNGLSILIIWVGGHQVAASAIQVGDMMAFLQYAMQVVFSFLMMSFAFIMLPRAAVSAGRVAEVLKVEPVIKDPVEPRAFSTKTRGLVEFRNVSFRYPNAEENVLCNISFTANPGETTAIIGSTGSGKSTIINLIPRFFDVTEGAVYVDGRDVREVNQGELRDRIGYIPQQGILFSGTVESNLRYSDDEASLETLKQATDIAQASDFIARMEGGLSAPISQGGANVSGGQKQRLAIARALVKRPPIYIFDDALSALDFKTDAALRRALKQETGVSTMIIVTQRVSTIKNAEQIIVLDEGQVVGKGTHAELMKTCETYREMAASQLTREELSL